MRPFLLLCCLVACKKPAPEPVAPTTPVASPAGERPAPSLEQLQGVVRQLAVHDPEPDCATIEASLAADPVVTWLYVVNTVTMPPATPMRAAGCLIRLHPEESADSLVQWVSQPGWEGLGKLVLANLETLPEPVAVRVVEVGLKGGLAADVKAAAQASGRESVRALAAE